MASIYYEGRKNRWRVAWRDRARKQHSRLFADRSAAEDFRAELNREFPSRRGRRSRTRAQMVRFLAENFEVADDGCWNWTGHLHKTMGYGQVNWKRDGRVISFAHRVMLAAIGEPLPDGLVVDHLCRNRACCNPDHLELVTGRENVMRSPIAPGALNAAKTHCPQGHEYTPENTLRYYGLGGRKTWMRVCRTCSRERSQKAAQRRREAQQMEAAS